LGIEQRSLSGKLAGENSSLRSDTGKARIVV
jgi:hypothetical protein